MSDIESFESLEGYETLIEYEGFETPVERSLAYIEENRQERSRDLEDAQMHDDYVEMFIEVSAPAVVAVSANLALSTRTP